MEFQNFKGHLPTIILVGASILWGLTWIPLKAINADGIEGIALIFFAYGLLSLTLFPLVLKGYAYWKNHKRMMLLIAFFGGARTLRLPMLS